MTHHERNRLTLAAIAVVVIVVCAMQAVVALMTSGP